MPGLLLSIQLNSTPAPKIGSATETQLYPVHYFHSINLRTGELTCEEFFF